jgi:prepilin-type processing-associated H-X9-DG protein
VKSHPPPSKPPHHEMAQGPARLRLLVAVGILVGVLANGYGSATAEAASPCSPRAFEGLNYIICTFDLRAYALRLFWKDEGGQPYGGFDHLPRKVNGAPIVFAMNAGMYDADLSPVGLYIENGKTLKRANTANGPGNFHLKPNGIFYVSGQEVGVLTTERFLSQRPRVEFATQSGPMLVIDGRIHPKILPGSTSRKMRNGVGIRDAHTVVFVVSEGPVTFWEFARLFRDNLGSANALFLDGSISSLYAPALRRSDTLYPMGPIIAASERK